MSAPRSVLSTGYVALDVIRQGRAVRQRAGGTAANVAANLAHLGWDSSLLARIGQDFPGRRVLADLRRAGVSDDGVILEADTSTPVVVHDVISPHHRFAFSCPDCGRRSPRYRPISTEQLTAWTERVQPMSRPDVFFADRVSVAALQLFERFGAAGSLTVLEPSSSGSESLIKRAGELAQVVKWSDEMRTVLHAVLLQPRRGQVQIETLGSRGLRFRVGFGDWRAIAAPAVCVIDTAGAGDWLTAAFVENLDCLKLDELSDGELHRALGRAQAVAALSCTFAGARSLSALPAATLRDPERALRSDLVAPHAARLPGRRSRVSHACHLCLVEIAS